MGVCTVGAVPEKESKKWVKIPLGSIYSTNGQKGLKAVTTRAEERYATDLLHLRREFRSGASNVILVRGKDIAEAVNAARFAFTAARSADVPVDPDDPRVTAKGAPVWLVAYLGTAGSSPPYLLVQSVERQGKKVRVTFRKAKTTIMSSNLHRYFVWVPLGKLEAGTYALELIEAGKKEVTLLRRVRIPKKGKG
jgi:hypothetical protein